MALLFRSLAYRLRMVLVRTGGGKQRRILAGAAGHHSGSGLAAAIAINGRNAGNPACVRWGNPDAVKTQRGAAGRRFARRQHGYDFFRRRFNVADMPVASVLGINPSRRIAVTGR